MMKIKHGILLILFLLFTGLFISCTTEVTLTLLPDDSVAIEFEGGAGQAFTKMLASASGLTGEGAASSIIDAQEVSYELARSGFADVKVEEKKGGLVQIKMKDKNRSSYVFTSGIIKEEKGSLSTAITRKSLEDFYKSADEQTRMTLDLLLAPVFNDEVMSEAEYLEMLASFYGQAAADEVSQSFVKINLISKDASKGSSKQTLRYPLSQLLCGNL
jgi:hypothetical protein